MEKKQLDTLHFLRHVKLDSKVEKGMEEMRMDILEKVHRRIEVEARSRRVKERWLVAASLALLLVFSGWLALQTDFLRLPHIEEFSALPGHQTTVTLPDGTVVMLNGGTRLTYDTKAFGRKIREVSLNGEAFFEVTKNKEVPFIVNNGEAQVKVLGTSFNVEGYSTDAAIRVTLASGKVSMRIADTSDDCVLEPGQQAVYMKPEHRLVRRQVKVDEVTAWREGEMYFDDLSLEEIARRLTRRFGVPVVIRSEALKQSRYNGAFTSKEDLERILSFLSLMDVRLHYEKKDGTIWIYSL